MEYFLAAAWRVRGMYMLSVLWIFGALLFAQHARATSHTPASNVFLNNVPTAVTFNDGDSFRVLEGPLTGSKARLANFNTLETFGPAHAWGTWDAYELYILAKKATLNARRGVWHCVSSDNKNHAGELDTDAYGRILWFCRDLALDQIRKGLAHAMSIDQHPADEELLAAQREAIAEKRGMWAHGVPEFVVTSLHSRDEYVGKAKVYNRIVSAWDGHSDPWVHADTYKECQNVCHTDQVVDPNAITVVAQALSDDAELAKVFMPKPSATAMRLLVSMYARLNVLPDWTPAAAVPLLQERLDKMRSVGSLGQVTTAPGACMVYVGFHRRYGAYRAACLQRP